MTLTRYQAWMIAALLAVLTASSLAQSVAIGRLTDILMRIDHNLAVIGDYGIPDQVAPNAPRIVR